MGREGDIDLHVFSWELGVTAELCAEWSQSLFFASRPILITNQFSHTTSSTPRIVATECVICTRQVFSLTHRSSQRRDSAIARLCTATKACTHVLACVRHTSNI